MLFCMCYGKLLQGHSEDMPLSELMGGALYLPHLLIVSGCYICCYLFVIMSCACVLGSCCCAARDVPLSELMGGARIRHIFQVRLVVTFVVTLYC
jgi:hypothetical protein